MHMKTAIMVQCFIEEGRVDSFISNKGKITQLQPELIFFLYSPKFLNRLSLDAESLPAAGFQNIKHLA